MMYPSISNDAFVLVLVLVLDFGCPKVLRKCKHLRQVVLCFAWKKVNLDIWKKDASRLRVHAPSMSSTCVAGQSAKMAK